MEDGYKIYQKPHFMKPLLGREGVWNLEVQVLGDPDGAGEFEYFGFVMTKLHHHRDKVYIIQTMRPHDNCEGVTS